MSSTTSQAGAAAVSRRPAAIVNVKPLVILSKYYRQDGFMGALYARSMSLLFHRIGIVCILSAAFAGAFASIVHYSGASGARSFDSECRVSTNPNCFGPYLK
jgi:hypothetical protein